MKKSPLLLLSLVAVLTACSGKTDAAGPNDWFSQKRKRVGLSAAEMNEVINQNDGCILVTQYTRTRRLAEWNGSIWMMKDGSTIINGFTRTTVNFQKKQPASVALGAYIGSTYDETAFQNQFGIGYNGSEYVFLNGPTDAYATDPEKLYNDLYDSIFEWGVSLLCGSHQFLASRNGPEYYAPQEMLDAATEAKIFKRITITGFELRTYKKYTDEPFAYYSENDKTYSLKSVSIGYNGHRLNTYTSEIEISSLLSANEKEFINFSSNLYSIQYINV